MNQDDRPSWFLLRTISGHERLTLGALRKKGLTAYVPLQVERPLHATRKAPRTRPLIPGYIFIALPDDEAYHLAKSVHGVIGFMERADGSPRPVPPKAVGVLILMEACHEYDETWEPPKVKTGKRYSHAWKPKARVMISDGPFAGHIGTVLRGRQRDAMEVLLSLFGRPFEIVVPHKHLIRPPQDKAA